MVERVRVEDDATVNIGSLQIPPDPAEPTINGNEIWHTGDFSHPWHQGNVRIFPALDYGFKTEDNSPAVAVANRVALVNALTAAQGANDGVVVLPPGRAWIDFAGGIILTHSMRIWGAGTGAIGDGTVNGSTLLVWDNTAYAFYTNDVVAHSVDFRDFGIEANGNTISEGLIVGVFRNSYFHRLALNGGNGGAAHGIRIKYISASIFSWVNWIHHCTINEFDIGLRNYGSDGWITENYIGGNRISYLDETTGGNWFAGNHLDNCANTLPTAPPIVQPWIPTGEGKAIQCQAGAAVTSTPGTTYVGNYLDKNDTAIYLVGSTPGVPFDCAHLFANNRIKVSLVADIHVRDAAKYTFANNDIRGTGLLEHSVLFTNSGHGAFINNTWTGAYTGDIFGPRTPENIPAINCMQWPSGVGAGAPIVIEEHPVFPATKYGLVVNDPTRGDANRTALVNAFAAAAAANVNGTVLLPPGEIYVAFDGGIDLPRCVKLVGQGNRPRNSSAFGASTFLPTANTAYCFKMAAGGDNLDNCELRDFGIEDNGKTITAAIYAPFTKTLIQGVNIIVASGSIGSGIHIWYNEQFGSNHIERCHIRKCGIGLNNECGDSRIIYNYFNDNTIGQLNYDRGGNGCSMVGNFYDAGGSTYGLIMRAVAGAGQAGSVIAHNEFQSDTGILLDDTSSTKCMGSHQIHSNRFAGCAVADIDWQDQAGVYLQGNLHDGANSITPIGIMLTNVGHGLMLGELFDPDFTVKIGGPVDLPPYVGDAWNKTNVPAINCYVMPNDSGASGAPVLIT